MAENSKINWTTHTFNPWIGCTKVSPGCLHCYAESLMDSRYGRVKWGKGNPRSRTAPSNWKKVRSWNNHAARDGIRPRVFCASLADWLDDEVPIEWLVDLLELVRATPSLDWLLLTKRPQNWRSRICAARDHLLRNGIFDGTVDWLGAWIHANPTPPANVWVGTTVEDQTRADERQPLLLSIPARVRFLSCEPLIGPVTLDFGNPKFRTAESYHAEIHWVIVGGESGFGCREMHLNWALGLKYECGKSGVAFWVKQLGGNPDPRHEIEAFPEELRIRELPTP
jgi:protein gp37